jgi:hypothetical protein
LRLRRDFVAFALTAAGRSIIVRTATALFCRDSGSSRLNKQWMDGGTDGLSAAPLPGTECLTDSRRRSIVSGTPCLTYTPYIARSVKR